MRSHRPLAAMGKKGRGPPWKGTATRLQTAIAVYLPYCIYNASDAAIP